MTKVTKFANESFIKAKKRAGFVNAYKVLRGIVKYQNYADNIRPWVNDSVVKYRCEKADDVLTNELFIDSCVIANKFIFDRLKERA